MARKDKIVEKAQKFVQKGNIDKAITEYKTASVIDPDDSSIRLRLGELYIKKGMNEEAVNEYMDVAKDNVQKGFYLKAIAVYKQVLKLDPGNIDIHNKLADLYTKQRLIADALIQYNIIIDVFEAKGKTSEMLELIKKMVEIAPDNIDARVKLANIYLKLGFDKDGYDEYAAALRKLLDNKRFDAAEKIYVDLFDNNPSEPNILVGLAEIYRQKGDADNFLKYGKVLAESYKMEGSLKEAKHIYDQILEMRSDDADSLEFIKAYGETARPDEVADLGGIGGEEEAEEGGLLQLEGEEDVEVVPIGDMPFDEEDLGVSLGGLEEAGEGDLLGPGEPDESAPLIDFSGMEDQFEELMEGEEEGGLELLGPEGDEGDEYGNVPFGGPEVIEDMEEGGLAGEVELDLSSGIAVEEVPEAVPAPPVPEVRPEEKAEEKKEEYVDLAAELGLDSEGGGFEIPPPPAGLEGPAGVEGGEGPLQADEEAETKFNLGIAYMEMELFDDAVESFLEALSEPSLHYDVYSRLGLCEMQKGSPGDAIVYYKKALKIGGRGIEEDMGLQFELALAYESSGNREEALKLYRGINNSDPTFRDVGEKVKELEGGAKAPLKDDVVEIELL